MSSTPRVSSPATARSVASRATLEALEYPALLALVAAGARTDLGAERVLALEPALEADDLERRRAALVETARLDLDGPLVPSLGERFGPLLARLGDEGTPLAGEEIVLVARLLSSAADAARRIDAADPPCPALARELEGLGDPAPLLAKIGRVLDAKGRVRDDASPLLVELAKQTRGARDRIYAGLERVRGSHSALFEAETTPLREGRLLLLLSAGARGRVPGLVHGRSGSEKSFYFEPLELVEENNTLQAATEAQEAERQRLLQDLRAEIAREGPLVARLADLVAVLDCFEAALAFAELAGARVPGTGTDGHVRLVAARHPLLEPRLARRREEVLGAAGHRGAIEPLDLELGTLAPEAEPGDSSKLRRGQRVLVVTGPNAGGKTVALKTLGLLSLAAQAGLPIPCAAGSELPLFGSIVATVGDEQDLLAERSTFSGRLVRLADVWSEAGERSLALVDELGSGTDPEEGAALAVALLERLLEAGGLAIITTHLTPVALAALEREGAGCAAMEFEPGSGRPTFRLQPGPPGASEAIALARRLALPPAWIRRAEELVDPAHRALGRSLAELEATRQELAVLAEEAKRAAADSLAQAARHERERATLEAERRVVGKRLEGELRAFRERVSAAMATEEKRLRDEFAAGRRRGVAAEATQRLFAEAPQLTEEAEPALDRPIEVGARVRHLGLGWSGTVETLTGTKAQVAVGGKRLSAAVSELVPVGSAAPQPAKASVARAVEPEPESAPELMLLGFTVEDALDAVDEFLDRALRAGRTEVRLVHGHGTGRLRDAIRLHLKKQAAVASSRPGAPNEGGNGATVVALR